MSSSLIDFSFKKFVEHSVTRGGTGRWSSQQCWRSQRADSRPAGGPDAEMGLIARPPDLNLDVIVLAGTTLYRMGNAERARN